MQYVVSRQRVIQCVAKYATKAEPHSKALKEVYGNIMKSIKDDGTSLLADCHCVQSESSALHLQ